MAWLIWGPGYLGFKHNQNLSDENLGLAGYLTHSPTGAEIQGFSQSPCVIQYVTMGTSLHSLLKIEATHSNFLKDIPTVFHDPVMHVLYINLNLMLSAKGENSIHSKKAQNTWLNVVYTHIFVGMYSIKMSHVWY